MQPDHSPILQTLSLSEPVVGFYDAPDPAPFAPLVEPGGPRLCIFAAYERWREGKTLHLTREKHGCGAMHTLGVPTRAREDLVDFLVGEEGLRALPELMNQWLDAVPGYRPRHDHVFIGPLRADQYAYLRSVTFFTNPDQLAVLVTGAAYYSAPGDSPVYAPFGSGCGQLASVLGDLDAPGAIIGATDQAMRQHLPPDVLAFTVTRPAFEQLCRWAGDPHSSLHNRFLQRLITARGGSLASRGG